MQSCFLERLGASQKDGANIHLPAFYPLEKQQVAPGNMPYSLDPRGALISGPPEMCRGRTDALSQGSGPGKGT